MLTIAPQQPIYVSLEPIDFRKGLDGTIGVCRQQLLKEPLDGALFLFRNRSCTTIRILCFDGQGFWLCSKRLSAGRFKWWPKKMQTIDYRALQVLLNNGDPDQAQFTQDWRPLSGNLLSSPPEMPR
jgi:transposase